MEKTNNARRSWRYNNRLRRIVPAAIATVGAAMATGNAGAASNSWTFNPATSWTASWSTPVNWAGGIVADGAGNLADFSTVNLSVNPTVQLDTPRTIGLLKFADTAQSNNWTLANNGDSNNVLTLNNGASQPVITVGNGVGTLAVTGQVTTISAVINSTNGFIKNGPGALLLSAANNITGTVTLNAGTSAAGADLYVQNNNALGTATLFIDPGQSNNCRVLLGTSSTPVTINNNIIIHSSRATAGANASVMTNNNTAFGGVGNGNFGGCVINGSITIDDKALSGGHISGPADANRANFLTINGPITLSAAYNAVPANLTNSAGNGLLLRSGNYTFAGGGSYFRAEVRSGDLRVGANNGIATNAYIDIAGNATPNPLGFGDLDLNGFNQTLVGIQNAINNGTPANVINRGTAPSTLTLTPVDPTVNPNSANLVFTAGGAGTGSNAVISDNSAGNGTLNIVINGAANGLQTFNVPSSNYHGSTTLMSGILSVNSINNGGANSSIGASDNSAGNLVFSGGTLRYTGGTTSTDRNYTLTNATSSTIDVSTAATTLTITGGGTGGGALTKGGAGTLQFSGNQTYTGNTTISGGALRVDGNLASANVSIASGATLAGTGTINGTVAAASGGIIVPAGAGAVGTLTANALTLNTGAQVNFEFGTGNDEMTIANSNGLTLNGGNLFLFNTGATTPFSSNGTYTLFNINGGIGGSVDNLFVTNPVAGKFYNITNSGSAIVLTIADATTIAWSDTTGNDLWTDAGNWVGGVVPNASGVAASFGTASGTGSVNLNGNKTVGGLVFNNSGMSFDIFGSGNLTLDNGSAAGAITVTNGTHTIDVPVVLAGNVAIQTTNSSDSLTLNGNISGAFAITNVGPGAVTLTGTNSFTNLSINGGTVNVGNGGTNGSLGTGPVSLANNAALNFNVTRTYNFGQNITGAGTLQQIGSGTITVGNVNVTAINVTAGALNTGSIAQSGGINVTGGNLTAAGPISGIGKVTVNTSGAVSLAASNTYSGGTEIDNGTVTLHGVNSIPNNSALAVNGGTLDLNGNSIKINNIQDQSGSTGVITNNGATGTVSTISLNGIQAQYDLYATLTDGANGGKVALVSFIENTASSQTGTDNQYRLALHHSNSYSGGTTVTKQSIEADASNAFGTGSVLLVQNNTSTNNTRVYVSGGITLPNDFVIAQPNGYNNATLTFGAIQYLAGSTGNATLTGSITQQANAFSGATFAGPATTSTDVLNVNGPVTTTGTANTISAVGNVGFGGGGSYSNLVVTNGKAIVNAPNGIATNAAVNMTSATLELNGNNQSITGLTGSGLATNSSATAATLTVNTSSNGTFSGVIGGNLHLVKSGSGVQTLSGVSTYTGSTIINGGTLKLPSPVTSPVGAYSFDDIRDTSGNPVTSGMPGQGYVVANDGSGGAGMNGLVNHSDNLLDPVNGTATITQGRFGNGLHLDGLGDTVDINSQIVDQAGAGNWSLSAWVRTTAGGSAFVSKNAGATTWNAGHSVYYLASNPIGSAGSLPTGVRNGGGFVQGDPTPASVTDGNWHLVTFVDNGGTKTVYVDGVAATMTMTGFTTADTSTFVRLGYNTDTVATDGAANFSGDLDEIKFFSIALNGTQVLGLFNNNVVPGGGSQYLPTATPVTLGASGATLDLSDNNQVIGSLTGVAGSNVLLGTGNLTTGGDNTSTTFAGVIGGNGGVVKTGSGTFTMTGANTYSGGTSVNAGTLIADKLSNGTISISGGLAKLTAKGTANNVSGTTVVPALTITGGSLDTTNNAMVLITANTSPATLRGYLQSGSLTSSTTAGGFAIGYADNSTLGRTTFGGVSVDATKLLVGFVYSGDSNLDGRVNALDFNAVASNFGGASKFWTNGDFSYDGTVNTVDFNALALNFNRSEPTPVPGLGALVPEPASMGAILMAGGWAMLHRRRRTMK